jgi:predicted TIM-barrel fold metal-dependent hydrolase
MSARSEHPATADQGVPRLAERIGSFFRELEGIEVIDAHQHAGSWASFGRAPSPTDPAVDVDPDGRARFMRSNGIGSAILHPNPQAGSDATAVHRSNQLALAMASKNKHAFTASAASVPLGTLDDLRGELGTLAESGFSALSFHHRFIGRPLDNALMDNVCTFAEEHSWPIFVHCLAESTLSALWRVARLARRFPRVQFVALAALSAPSQAQQALELAIERRNISFETSLMCSVPSLVEEFCRTVTAERLVFGSDLYMDPRPIWNVPSSLIEVAAAAISVEEKALILGGNVQRLLGRTGA